MLRENLKDAAEILTHIFNQPLEIPGAPANISLQEALSSYDPHHPDPSDLLKLLTEFVKYPGPTQTLVQELELLVQDLSSTA